MHFFFQILWSYIDVVFDWNICFTNCQPIKIRFSETHGNIKNMSSKKKQVQTSFYSAPTFPIASPPGWVEKRRHFIRPMHLEFRLKTRWIWMKVLINCGFIFWLNSCATRGWGWKPVVLIKYYAQKFAGNEPVAGEILVVLGWWTSWTMDAVLVCCKPMNLGKSPPPRNGEWHIATPQRWNSKFGQEYTSIYLATLQDANPPPPNAPWFQ